MMIDRPKVQLCVLGARNQLKVTDRFVLIDRDVLATVCDAAEQLVGKPAPQVPARELICEGCGEEKPDRRWCDGCQWAATRYGYRRKHISPAKARRSRERRASFLAMKQLEERNQGGHR